MILDKKNFAIRLAYVKITFKAIKGTIRYAEMVLAVKAGRVLSQVSCDGRLLFMKQRSSVAKTCCL